MKSLTKYLSTTVVMLVAVSVHLAQEGVHPGIDLYKQGKYQQAMAVLKSAAETKEFKSNAEIWNYLGLAYSGNQDDKDALKSFEKAVKLDPLIASYRVNLANTHIAFGKYKKAFSESEKALKIDPASPNAYGVHGVASFQLGKFDTAEKDADKILELDRTVTVAYVLKAHLVMERLSQRLLAGSTLKKEAGLLLSGKQFLATGKDLCKNNPDHKILDQEYESISAFSSYFSGKKAEPDDIPSIPEPNVVPLKILSKPRASYTDSARQANVQGTIKIAILFAADGQVKHILLLKGLGKGLDQNAIKAARMIRFIPQQRDGKPVSVVKMVEYSFAIY